MATDDAKENIADGLGAGLSFKTPLAPSPKKRKSKTRSKSIGPSGLSTLEEKPSALKESNGNRRKSAFPAVKSILVTNDIDEKKRREARRKSLARRRVSFNPEATLHSWDIVAYAHDETSSTVSDATRRASAVSKKPAQPSSDAEEPPSTPPERDEDPEPESGSSPANQRDAHKKKNRHRSSGIPPMNFNNPDDILSSSPLIENTSPAKNALQDEGDDMPGENDSQSSARLDAALRKASELAGTQKLDLDSDEDMSMVIAEDDITTSFKPWAKKNQSMDFEDQENEDPFAKSDESADEDMSMDITRAVGKIVAQQEPESPGSDDMSMDLTTAIGSIKQAPAKNLPSRRKSLKRLVSMLEPSQGSPAKRPSSRRTSLRSQAISEETSTDDQTMDFTVAIGAITSETTPHTQPPSKRTRASVDSSFGDETMDFTIAVGSIKGVKPAPEEDASKEPELEQEDEDEDMDMSMEFTTVVGPGIKRIVKAPEQVAQEAVTSPTPVKRNTPTPQKSPRKSPGRLLYPDLTAALSTSPQKALKITPSKLPGQPRRSLNVATPETKPGQQRIEDFEPSPFVRSTPQSLSKPRDIVSTPKSQPRNAPLIIPNDPIEAPLLSRRRSSLSNVQFSPLVKVAEEPTLRSAAILSNNIKLLSTPRKQTLISPVKRGMTPKMSQTPQKEATPKQKTPTPKKRTPRKSMSPEKKVAFGVQFEIEDDVPEQDIDEDIDDAERISLQDFLDLTRIRFMEVSATKRRHTAAPALFHDKEVEEQEQSLDQYVVAGACIVPEYECYSHACHELKQFISSGRDYVRTLEENVEEENPLLFSEYLTAPPDQRAIMDNQFKNLKTNARLETRGEWYTWRTNLLRDLKSMLLPTLDEFKQDESVLRNQELLLEEVLPPLQQAQERLSKECGQLQQRHDELNNCNREELEQARERLVAVGTELEEKRQLVARMQEELEAKEARMEAVKERKVECVADIKAAERVREECRGWSTTEVSELHAKVSALEQKHGWSITSASGSTITMTYKNDLELYFQPSAFATGAETPNASISLTYVGDSATPHQRPLTTSKRFFLQLIRAHLHCIPQSQTRVKDLLDVIKNGWATASAVAEGVRWLEHSYITDETILSDERMAVSSNMLLPALQTKVKVTFEIGVSLGSEGAETEVTAKAELVYGEKFKTEKMGTFLEHHCGSKVKEEKEMSIWADACLDLVERLRATGRKGERV